MTGQSSVSQILSYYHGKRILVTGASGYLATKLLESLQSVSCTIVRLSRGGRLTPLDGVARVVDVIGDIRAREPIAHALEEVDVVFHFAAQTSVYVADENPFLDLEINVLPMLNLLETCRAKRRCPTIVFSGTTTEVGLTKNLPVGESQRDCPITVYDIHKLTAENYLKQRSQQGVVRGTILRLANVYGPGPKSSSSDRGVINMMVRKALAKEELTIYGQGDHLRDYVYVDDVVAAFLMVPSQIDNLNGRHFVIGSGQGHTICEAVNLAAQRVALRTGHLVPVKHVKPPRMQSPIEARDFVADTRGFSEAAGWHAQHSLIEGIDRTIEAFLV